MTLQTEFMRRLGMSRPVIQAPMAGGGDTPALVAAVGNSGGIGFIGAAYLTPEQIAEAGRTVRSLTSRPFGINLFAPQPPADRPADPYSAVERVAGYYRELGLPAPTAPQVGGPTFEDQFAACLEVGAAAFSFTFGLIPKAAIAALKLRRMVVLGTATTVAEAVALENAGVDAVVAQGSEAGGHRGTFAGAFESSMVGTVALVPQSADAVSVPVVASGGIMDGRGVAAALSLGAAAAQLGTAFLTCDEAGIAECYKSAILEARETDTRVTRAFSGRAARGIVNRVMSDVDAAAEKDANSILPFPQQNVLTRPLRIAAGKQGRAEFLSLWAGQGLGLARRQKAAALVERLDAETAAILNRLGKTSGAG